MRVNVANSRDLLILLAVVRLVYAEQVRPVPGPLLPVPGALPPVPIALLPGPGALLDVPGALLPVPVALLLFFGLDMAEELPKTLVDSVHQAIDVDSVSRGRVASYIRQRGVIRAGRGVGLVVLHGA